MTIELINTGSELLLGRVLNTHQQWICRQLTDRGYVVSRQVAISDRAADIREAVREALGRADLILTTGGLGPTSDDLTRDLIAELLGRPLRHDDAVHAQVRGYFESRGRTVPPRTIVEARIPEGALVLPNAHGTAPGLVLEVAPNPWRDGHQPAWLVMLPGPPRELRPMFVNQVVPWLQQRLPLSTPFVCRTLRTTGLGESLVEDRLDGPLQPLLTKGLELGFCARVGDVEVRFAGRGSDAAELVAHAERIAREQLVEFIYGVEDETLEAAVVAEMTARRLTLALAESCTGGHVANRITNVPGASAVLLAGHVTYANAAKIATLGVKPETLAAHGAVSEPVAREMALGARTRNGADFALSITGIAGPSGGSPQKPVGTVFIGLDGPEGTTVVRQLNPFDRETFKYLTAQQSLALLLCAVRLLPLPSSDEGRGPG